MRVWLLTRALGIDFYEQTIDLSVPDKAAQLKGVSPSGRVPVLVVGPRQIWDSMAIIEYLHDAHPDAGVWPADAAARLSRTPGVRPRRSNLPNR